MGRDCSWALVDDDQGLWDTECGNLHQFTTGGPQENDHCFCPYCGGLLIELEGEGYGPVRR